MKKIQIRITKFIKSKRLLLSTLIIMMFSLAFTFIAGFKNNNNTLGLLQSNTLEALATNPESDTRLTRFCMMEAVLPQSVTLSYDEARQTSYGVTAGYSNQGFCGTLDFHLGSTTTRGASTTFSMIHCCYWNNDFDDRCDFSWETDNKMCARSVGEYQNERYQAYRQLGIFQ